MVICIALPPLIPVIIVTALLYYAQVKLVDKAQRPIKQVANQAVSPIISNLNELLAGRELVRCGRATMGCTKSLVDG